MCVHMLYTRGMAEQKSNICICCAVSIQQQQDHALADMHVHMMSYMSKILEQEISN